MTCWVWKQVFTNVCTCCTTAKRPAAQVDTRQAAKVSAIIAAMPRTHSSISSAPSAGGGLPGLEVLLRNPKNVYI